MPIARLRFENKGEAVVLKGTTRPGAVVRVENASAAPMHGGWQSSSFKDARANAQGRFEVEVPAGLEGDQLRVRSADGLWQVVRVETGGVDPRRAEFNPQGLRLVEQGDGRYGIDTVSINNQACEPHTQVRMFNMRDGQGVQFTLDDEGHFPPAFRVQGQPGDVFAIACSDGVHNADFSAPCGFLAVPPPASAREGRPVFEPPLLPGDPATLSPITGPLFDGPPTPFQAVQGEDLGDCYFVAAAAAFALASPEKLEELITDNEDGTYTVVFKRYDAEQQQYVSEPITVTNLLPVDEQGRLRYGGGAKHTPGTQPLWFSILEKAYASWKGGYTAIINGFPYDAFEAFAGDAGTHVDVRSAAPDALFDWLKAEREQHHPTVVWTAVDSPEQPFSGSQLAPDHAYSVLAVAGSGAQRTVTLLNPYGHLLPSTGDADRGLLTVPWDTFLKHFVGAGSVPL
ncbi:MAG: hypothetical protein IPJ65_21925 [Archangiaceae bacterium]|nr:hypothetical protein [Archangiaceae bacterium]